MILLLAAFCGMIGTDFVCDFPVLEDQFVVSYCGRAWAMPQLGVPTSCSGLDAECDNTTDPFCLCDVPGQRMVPSGPPMPLPVTVTCAGPFPSDPNTPPCQIIVHEAGVNYATHPVTMFKIQAIATNGGRGCDAHWVPGTLECTPPGLCDFDFVVNDD